MSNLLNASHPLQIITLASARGSWQTYCHRNKGSKLLLNADGLVKKFLLSSYLVVHMCLSGEVVSNLEGKGFSVLAVTNDQFEEL